MTVGNDSAGNGFTASSVGAVTDTVAKVDIVAETGSIGRATAKGWGQGEHVFHTGLLREKC